MRSQLGYDGRMDDAAKRAMAWRNLRVGDRIRIVRVPSEFSRLGYTVHPSTVRLYRLLVKRGRSLRIAEWMGDMPWIHCRVRRKNGEMEFHYLGINRTEDSWVLVKRRK